MLTNIPNSARTNRGLLGKPGFYPSRMFSLSEYYVPTDIKEIFEYCKYLVLMDPAVSGAIHRMAEAPITELLYDHHDKAVRDKYKVLLESKMDVRAKFSEALFDLLTYSNAFLSFEVPVTRYLVSPNIHPDFKSDAEGGMASNDLDKKYEDLKKGQFINPRYRATSIDWELTGDGQFKGKCPLTGEQVQFIRQDRYYPSSENISIKKWNPNQISIEHNEITGKSKYYYTLSYESRKLIKSGDRDYYNEVPWEYIIAARENRDVRIRNDQLYHMSNVKISGAYAGWGLPRLASCFKMIFYYMTLLRANEAAAIGRVNDLTVLFPSTNSGLMDPASSVPGSSFKNNMAQMVNAHKRDKNYVGISPIPVGSLSVFGQGRMQLVSAEMEPVLRMICVAIGLPYDMLFGGGAYTGQAIGQRVFTIQTGITKESFDEFLDFTVKKASSALGRDRYTDDIKITLKDIEGPDDLQRKNLRLQLAMSNKSSLRTSMEDLGMDPDKEFEAMEDEAKILNRPTMIQMRGQAAAQMEAQEIAQRGQMEGSSANEMQQMPGGEEPHPNDPESEDPNDMSSADGVGPSKEVSEDAQKQAQTLYEYIQNNPELAGDILDYSKKEYPEAHDALQMLLRQEQGTEAEVPDIPSMEAPSYQFEESQKNNPSIGGEVPTSTDQLPGKNL